jgi:hypothetical protein
MRRVRKALARAAVVALVAGATIAVAGAAPSADAQTSGCPSVGTNFSASGPFSVTVQSGSQHTYYSPSSLGSQGCDTHPVILWGNGTGTSVSSYDSLLRHFASHGFIVAAANTGSAGSGAAMLAGLDNLTSFNSQSGNRFNGRVDLDNVGSTGHSQGGGGAIETAADSRVDTAFPFEGWLAEGSDVRPGATAFYMAGENDTIVSSSSVEADFNDTDHAPAAFGELDGASHFTPVGNGGGFRGAATAWARWMLMGDGNGSGLFQGANCGLCTSSAWSDYEANSLLQQFDTPDPDPDPDPDPQCVTAVNLQHESAGRATSFFYYSIAVGSGDFLGFSVSTTSLQETSPGFWEEVDSC